MLRFISDSIGGCGEGLSGWFVFWLGWFIQFEILCKFVEGFIQSKVKANKGGAVVVVVVVLVVAVVSFGEGKVL